MKNTQKIKYNLLLGFGSQFLTIILGIVVPRLTMVNYGSEINGLINSVVQIYTYIGLLEAGIGAATIQALYSTVSNDDRSKTNSILAATNRYYTRTGSLYVLAVLAFSVLYPLLVSSDIPTVTVILIILLNGVESTIGFFVQRKYLLLLQAEGKNYVEATLTMIINALRNVAKIIMMSMGMDVLLVQTVSMLIGLIQAVYISLYIRRNYSWIDLKVAPDYKAISQSKNVLVHQFSTLVFNNTDSIILAVFCGLKVVSVYVLYTMLFSMISTALGIVINGIIFSLGQAYHTDRKKFDRMYDAYELCYMTLVFALYSVAYYFILPFINCYTAGITDINYIDPILPTLMVALYLLSCGRSAPSQAINIAGHFKKTQYRSILESLINIVVSLLAVQQWGIYGVLIGTIAALVYRVNDVILYTSKYILMRSPWITYRRWLINVVVFIGIHLVSRQIPLVLDSYGSIIGFCIPYLFCTLVIFYGVALITNPSTAKLLLQTAKNMLRQKRG